MLFGVMPRKAPVLFSLSLLLLAFPAAANVDYYLFSNASVTPVDPGARIKVTVAVSGIQSSEATDAIVTIPLPAASFGIGVTSSKWLCRVNEATVTCEAQLAQGGGVSDITVNFNAPLNRDGIRFHGQATIETRAIDDHPDNNTASIIVNVYRMLTVTTPDDFGAGSLRSAINEANARCDAAMISCKMTFARPMMIEPTSPLPAITACDLLIDSGLTENIGIDADRPVEISGAKAGFANGLELRGPCFVRVRGFAINRFQGNGVVMAQAQPPNPYNNFGTQLLDCFIGTDATGREARPNGMRGISVETPHTVASIGNSIISGNRYSGVAVWEAQGTTIFQSRIGLNRDNQPLGNGSSGVFINSGAASVHNSLIANNAHFGVAVGPAAKHVAADVATMFDNGLGGLDWGLDGPTMTDPTGRMPPAPILLDATYDAAKKVTTVRGILPGDGRRSGTPYRFGVRIYERSGTRYTWRFPQKDFFQTPPGDIPFTLDVLADLRGKEIYGTTTFYSFDDGPETDTSEFSTPVDVHP